MLTNQLSSSFLTKHIGVDGFALLKDSYCRIIDDGHFEKVPTDKELAALFFEAVIASDFFEKRSNLKEFCNALPSITQDKIRAELEVSDFNKLIWTKRASSFFVDVLGLSERFRNVQKSKVTGPEGYYTYEKPPRRFKKLKRYQGEIFFDVFDYVKDTRFARCIIQMPTGSGKTRTSMEIVCELMNATGRSVLWVANTEELCDQAIASFDEVWEFIGARNARAINHMRVRDVPDYEAGSPTFHVASLQSISGPRALAKLKEKSIVLSNLELLVVDEAHIAIAPTYKNAIGEIASNGAKLIGLTATPGRQLKSVSGADGNKELSDFFYNKRFELCTGDESPIEYLRREGILSNAKFVSIEGASIDKHLSSSELNACKRNKTIPKRIEELLTKDSARTAVIFDQLIKLLDAGKKVIFFGTSVPHSQMVSTFLSMKGYRSAHIDGETGSARNSIISDFKKGNLEILCNYGVLSTGFDDPGIDVVFMARPTNSIVLYSQIIGRGLRGPLVGGTDSCEIYTVFDNIEDLPDNQEIYSYFDDYFL